MADNVMTFRLVVKEIAAGAGRARHLHAQAAGRPAGLGHAHPHVAVRGRHQRLPRRRRRLRPVARWPRASSPGCCAHAREITAVTNQWVNSYKRLIVGYEAPVYVTWARNNRSALVRVPVDQEGQAGVDPDRVPRPDPACNPYLAFAVILAAGLRGHRGGLRAARRGLRQPLRAVRRGACWPRRSSRCPGRWPRRSTTWSAPSWWPRRLGEHVFEWFLRNKRAEWAGYKAQVTQFELDRYLPNC